MPSDAPLRIALLAYRGKPHVGGQGVYTRHLAKALVDLGHHVEVLGGQPYPVLDDRVPLVELPSLDIYNDHFPMRMPGLWELKHWTDFVEVSAFSFGTFPEPLAFSMRAWDHLRHRQDDFDIVQDNQCLGYGLLLIERQLGLPILGTIHHPITVDRRLEMQAPSPGTSGSRCGAGTPSSTCRTGWPSASSGSSRCRRTPSRTSSPTTRSTPTGWPSCPSASTSTCSSRCPRSRSSPAASSPRRRPTSP